LLDPLPTMMPLALEPHVAGATQVAEMVCVTTLS
jgi:hypothetical protein